MQAVCNMYFHTCCSSAREKKRERQAERQRQTEFVECREDWRREWDTGIVKLRSSLSMFVPGYRLFTAMADILYECLAETREGVL